MLVVLLQYIGLNPYKMVEMFSKYHPVVPVEFHSDELYAEPSSEVYSKVKMEKTDQSEFWARLKETKYKNDTEKIEKMAFDGCEGKA
jgi:hypothetical protein